jgi:hypothetical protein
VVFPSLQSPLSRPEGPEIGTASNPGRLTFRAGGVNKDVAFVDADHSIDNQIDAAYRTKYRRYAKSITDRINSPGARSTTIKLVPRSSGP